MTISRINLTYFFVATSFLALSLRADQSLSYETLGNLRMKAIGLSMASETKVEDVKDPKKALTISIPEDQKHRMAYQLFIAAEKRKNIDATCDDEALKILFSDLDILGSVLNRINNVQTYFGEAALAKMLASPLACNTEQSAQLLANRKSLIQLLVDNPELLAQCDKLLVELKNNQTNFLSYWAPEAPLTKELISKLYFGKASPASFNKNSAMLEAGVQLSNAYTGFCLCGDLLLLSLLNYGIMALTHKSNPAVPAPTVKSALLAGVQFYNPYNYIKVLGSLDTPEQVAIRKQQAKQSKMTPAALRRIQTTTCKVGAAVTTLMLGYKAMICKRAIDQSSQFHATCNYLQERLIGVSTYVLAARQLVDLSLSHPEFAKGLKEFLGVVAIFEQKNDDLRELVKLLMTNTFTGRASFFSLQGRVLAAHSLMQSVKDELLDVSVCLGELDACVAIAHTYKRYEQESVGYSFAQLYDQQEPYVRAVDLWNPVVNLASAVVNSVELGHPQIVHHMILTGSNKAGKSTFLKAIMIAQLFAQTITIVAAKQFISTPQTCLMTYMNVSDNTAEGQSLFAAQVARAKKIVQLVDGLQKGDRAFIIIDEIFTGTGSANAAKAALKVVNHLSESERACLIIATHFVDALPLLEKTTKGRCKNYKFDADKDANGNLFFRYKLEEGISQTNIANEILGSELGEIDFSTDLGDL